MSESYDKSGPNDQAGQARDKQQSSVEPGDGKGYELASEESTDADQSPARPAGVAARPETGQEAGEAPQTPTAMGTSPFAPFVEGFGGIRLTLIVFAALMLCTLVIVGVRAGGLGFSQLLIHLASVVLVVASNGAIGGLAVIAAARCVGTRVAEPELFALRMLTAAAAFQLLFATGTPIPTRVDDWILGLVGYLTVVWLLFRLTPRQTGIVVAWHAGLVALFLLSFWVWNLRETPVQPKPSPEPSVESDIVPSVPHAEDAGGG